MTAPNGTATEVLVAGLKREKRAWASTAIGFIKTTAQKGAAEEKLPSVC